MAINRVDFGGDTLIDLTGDTLESADQLLKGIIAHAKDGSVITGQMEAGGSGGGGAAPEKWNDVTFIDYDGTFLYSYTLAEAQALTELPELPTHDGLICQGWNWTLESIKALNLPVTVGAMYITDDGATRLHIRIATVGRMTVPLYIGQTVANGVSIEWGDGSAVETLTGTGNVNTSHTYAKPGNYIISLAPKDGCTLSLGGSDSVLGSENIYRNMLRAVFIGCNVTSIGNSALQSCMSLENITIPGSVKSIGDSAFKNCYSLENITIPGSVKSIGDSAFQNCYSLSIITIGYGVKTVGWSALQSCISLESITIPGSVKSIEVNVLTDCKSICIIVFQDGVTSINMYSLTGCYCMASIKIPGSVTSIGEGAFQNWSQMRYYDFTACTSIPTLSNTNAFSGIPSDCQILIPAALYDEWSAATNWATYASYMVAV